MLRFLKRWPFLKHPSTRRFLKQLPVIRHAMRATRKIRKWYYRGFGRFRLRKVLAANAHKRIVIGAGDRYDSGWIPTQGEFLNLANPADWEQFFQPGSVEAMLAEHVWEHLSPEEGGIGARICYKYLSHGGYLRVAVPDGLHPDPAYIDLVKPDSPIANGHKALYTYRTLSNMFESSGFRVKLYEYFDEAGVFHEIDRYAEAGTIWRSKRSDPRNSGGTLLSVYPGSLDNQLQHSSIILDACKD
jgi:predicted SAM-dependent methyltransferase